MSSSQQPAPSGRRFLIAWLIIGFAICNFVTPLIMESAMLSDGLWPLIGILCGFIAGQCPLLAIWGVLGPSRATARLIVTLAIGVFLMASFGVGATLAGWSSFSFGEMICCPLFLPLVLLAFQLPLWVFKLFTGGRIVHVGTHAGQSTMPRRQFGLQHVMGGTLVVAVALSLASSGLLIFDAQRAEGWISLLAYCLYFMVVSAFATLPCLWAAMIAKNKQTATGIIAVYTLLMCLLLVIILGLLSGGRMPGEAVVMLFLFHGTLMAVILGTLRVAWLSGYIFIGWRRPQTNLQTGCPFAVQDDSPEGSQPAEPPAPGVDDPPNSIAPSG